VALTPSQAAALAATHPHLAAAAAAAPGGAAAALWVPAASAGQLPLAGVDLESLEGLEGGATVLPVVPEEEAVQPPQWARLVAPPEVEPLAAGGGLAQLVLQALQQQREREGDELLDGGPSKVRTCWTIILGVRCMAASGTYLVEMVSLGIPRSPHAQLPAVVPNPATLACCAASQMSALPVLPSH
jgi:hypothetical protein